MYWSAFKKTILTVRPDMECKKLKHFNASKEKKKVLDKWGLCNGSEVSPAEMFIHVDKVSSYINPSKDRVDGPRSVMRE